MKRVLLDTNILLDIAFKREQFCENSSDVLRKIKSKNLKLNGFISATTIKDIYYLIAKGENKRIAYNFLKDILNILDITSVDKAIIFDALNSKIKDFEDAIQESSALLNDIDIIITRNEKDFKNSRLEVLNPKDFLKIYSK